MKVLVSCEHARNDIPPGYDNYFRNGKQKKVQSHRGWDPGAEIIYHKLKILADSSFIYPWTRLLIEPNRSLHNQNLFSEFTKHLSREEKDDIINKFYQPYRSKIRKTVSDWIDRRERIFHVGVHSFTPILNGKERKADVTFLYDPSRILEKQAVIIWKKELLKSLPNAIIRFNYPYLGKSDGLTTALRKEFGENYAGIELEINQKHVKSGKIAKHLIDPLLKSFSLTIEILD